MGALLVGLVAAPTACRPADPDLLVEDEDDRSAALSAAEEAAIVELANTATFEELDVEIGLDVRAARNIVERRPFASFAELDAVPYVGSSAIAKLLAHAGPVAEDPACLILSEYVEGWGNYNKAVEIYNCGAGAADLGRVGICLVRNSATTCSVTRMLGATSLSPGAVWGVCRSRATAMNDPHPHIVAACDEEAAGVMTFDGDDRLVLFEDLDRDGAFDLGVDAVLDTFGVVASRPPGPYWAEKVLRRCDLTPFNGFEETAFFPWDHYTQHARSALEHYGQAPDGQGCL